MRSPHQVTALVTAARALGERERAKGAGMMDEHVTVDRAELRRMFTDNERLLAGQRERIERLNGRIRDALLHYQIGRDASAIGAALGFGTDWQYVAECMVKALRGEEETPPVAPRDYTRDPEDDDGDPETTARMWDGHEGERSRNDGRGRGGPG